MATGLELATAYVSLTVSTRGMGKDIAREFSGAERAAGSSGDKAGKRFAGGVKSSMAKIGGMVAGAFAVSAGVDFFKGAIDGASNLEQSVGGVEAVFGKYAKGVKKDSKAAAQSLGLTENAYNELITVSGAMLKNKGLDDFAGKSKNLITTGADLAATFGGSTKDAVDALNAAMRGESDPIERYGISLNETAVNAVLAAKGQSKLTGAALDQAKAQARLELITKQSKDAQGAFGREADTTAGKQERLTATMENNQVAIGQKLLPVYTTFLEFIAEKFLPGIGKVGDFIGKIWEAVTAGFSGDTSSFTGFLGVVAGFGDTIGAAYETITTGVSAFFAALEEGDVTSDGFVGFMETIGDFLHRVLPPAIETGRRAFAAIQEYIAREVIPRFLGIVDAIKGFVAVALPIVIQFVTGMIERIRPMIPTIQGIFGTIGGIITAALDLIKAVIERVTAVIKFVWERWGQGIMDFIAEIWRKILAIIEPALKGVQALIQTFTKLFKGDWQGAWESFKTVFSSAWKTVRGAIDLAMTLLGKALSIAWSGIVTTAGRIWDGITEAISGPLDRVMQFIQENFLDKINGLFAFLKIPVKIQPIWKQSNVGTGMWKAGREYKGGVGGSRHGGMEPGRAMGGALPSGGGMVKPVNANPGFPWGRYPSGGVHRAIDFPVPTGTPVRAPYSGTVMMDGWDSGGFGVHVRTRDSDGNYTILGHLSKEFVNPGQTIRAGQVIGLSGNTGNSTGPHLHMERRTSLFNGASAFNFTNGSSGAGAGWNPVADLMRNGISTIASGARGFASRVGGPFGPLFANLIERLVKGVGSRGLSMLGIEGGELRPRLYDQGGMIPPGDTLVRNLTGKPETLLPYDLRESGSRRGDIDRLIAALERVNMHATISAGTVDRAIAARL